MNVPARANLLELAPSAAAEQIRAFMARAGEPAYRANQALRHLWLNPAPSFDRMTELPAALRDLLAQEFELPRLEVIVSPPSLLDPIPFWCPAQIGAARLVRRDRIQEVLSVELCCPHYRPRATSLWPELRGGALGQAPF